MEPSQLLIGLLIAGLLGAIFLTAGIILLLSAFVECPECRKKQSKKARFCGDCGVPMTGTRTLRESLPVRRRPKMNGQDRRRPADLREIAAEISELSSGQREELGQILSEMEGAAGGRSKGKAARMLRVVDGDRTENQEG